MKVFQVSLLSSPYTSHKILKVSVAIFFFNSEGIYIEALADYISRVASTRYNIHKNYYTTLHQQTGACTGR